MRGEHLPSVKGFPMKADKPLGQDFAQIDST